MLIKYNIVNKRGYYKRSTKKI